MKTNATSRSAFFNPRALIGSVLCSVGFFLPMAGLSESVTGMVRHEAIAKTPGTWTATGSMSTARWAFTATLLTNGKVLVAGGDSAPNNPIAGAELYDPSTGAWAATGSMTTPREDHTATLLPDGRVLVVGGRVEFCLTISSAELYDPSTGTWSETGAMQSSRSRHFATLISSGPLAGKVLAAGGYINSNDGACGGAAQLASAELYDPTTGLWSATNDMTKARQSPLGVVLPDASVLAIGVLNCCPYHWFNSAESYDSSTQLWTPTSSRTTPANGAAVLLPEGKVLVAGGIKGTQPTTVSVADSELFDSSTEVWTATTSMFTDRGDPTVTLLASGQALAAGGSSYRGGVCSDLTSSELYDSATGVWFPTGDMTTARRGHTATLLPNGQVLVAGGTNCAINARSSAELYTPPSPTEQAPWIELKPTEGPPRPRELHVAVYDSTTNRMITHGGGVIGTALGDAWVLTNADGTETNFPTWTKLLPTNPVKRYSHSGVYDAFSNRMIIFGGFKDGQSFNDVWVLTNANGNGGDPEWVQLTPSGGPPVYRQNHTAVYDPVSNRMTIFGGYSGSVCFGDVWVLTNANGMETTPPSWIQLFPSGTPIPVRNGHSAVFDANSNRMIVFGGGCADSSTSNDVWVLTNANGFGGDPEWVELAPDGRPPSPRYSSVAVYDPTTNRMVAFGGGNFSVTFNDTWVLTNANGAAGDTPTWLPLAPGGTLPPTREQFAATYAVSSNRLSIFGGDNFPGCCSLLNDVWVLPDANGIGGDGGTCLPPPAGLVSWWSGDKTAADVQGTNPGVLKNGASFKRGMVGPGFVFDGIDDLVDIPNSASLSQARITLDAWVYPTGKQGAHRHIISKDNVFVTREYIIGIGSIDKFVADIWLPNHVQAIGTTSVQLNTWYHVAMTHDGAKLRLYVNGLLDGIVDAAGDIVPTPDPVGIGGNTFSDDFFKGIIDEAQIFSRALTDAEILAIYQAGADGQCKPDIFVASIDPSYTVSGRGFRISTSTVIEDVNGSAISDATVKLGVILPSGSALLFPLKTDATGQADISFAVSDSGLYQFKVRNVKHPTREYDASLNIETSDTLLIP